MFDPGLERGTVNQDRDVDGLVRNPLHHESMLYPYANPVKVLPALEGVGVAPDRPITGRKSRCRLERLCGNG